MRVITEKDCIIWAILRDENFKVTKTGILMTKLLRGCRKSTGPWRPAGWVSESRNGTKNYMRVRYKGVLVYIHRAVFAKFYGYLSKFKTVNHLRLDGTRNAPANLELVTPSANLKHALGIYRAKKTTAAEYRQRWIKGSRGAAEQHWRGKDGTFR